MEPITALATRCPYCHATVDPEHERWLACGGCLARHHRECFSEHGACGTCGRDVAFGPPRRRPAFALALTGFAGVVLGVAVASLPHHWVSVRTALERPTPATGLATVPALAGRAAAAELVQRAMESRAQGDRDAALTRLDNAVVADPRFELAFRCRGLLHKERGELLLAFADLTRAVELDPASPQAWGARGSLRLESGDAAGATADFDRALALDPALRWVRELRAGPFKGC